MKLPDITHAEGIGTSLLWNIKTKPDKALHPTAIPQLLKFEGLWRLNLEIEGLERMQRGIYILKTLSVNYKRRILQWKSQETKQKNEWLKK